MKRGSSLRFMACPMPLILASVLGSLIADLPVVSQLAHFFGRILHGLDDVDVARAAAEISRKRLADLLFAGVLVALEQGDARHHHARSAVAALQAVLLGEALLHGMQLAALLQPLYGGDFRPVGLHCKHGARLDRLAVHDHRAGAAMRGVAADVRAGHPEHFPDEVHQQQARLDFGFVRRAVDRYAYPVLRHGQAPPARSTALPAVRAVTRRACACVYSAEPRRSAPGAPLAAANRAASMSVFSSGILPARNFAASAASTGVSPAFVSAMPALPTAPFPSSASCTAAAATAKSPVLRFSLTYAPPLRGGGAGMRTSTSISAGARAVAYSPW